MPSDGSGLVRFGEFELRLRGNAEIRLGHAGHTRAIIRRGDGVVSLVKSRDGSIKARNAADAAFQDLLLASKRAKKDGTVP